VILSCAADRLELEMAAARAERREEDMEDRFPRTLPWIELGMDLLGHFSKLGESEEPFTWSLFFRHLMTFFTQRHTT
jgi:hypothetical protein